MHRRPSGRGNLPLLVVSIAAGLLLVLVVVDYAFPTSHPQAFGTPLVSQPSLPSNLTTSRAQVLVPSGTNLNIDSGAFNDVVFGLAMGASVSGTFMSNAPVTAYLLTPAAFESLETDQSAPGSLWSVGPVDSGGIELTVPAGTWYVAFTSANPQGSTMVEFTTSLVAVYPPPGGAPLS
ncbi:MAG: hypothetical protein L3K17_00575 [Thermoplasmata archaeon]|nr:hypothetical protein [Thermoplasmata archaeon]